MDSWYGVDGCLWLVGLCGGEYIFKFVRWIINSKFIENIKSILSALDKGKKWVCYICQV